MRDGIVFLVRGTMYPKPLCVQCVEAIRMLQQQKWLVDIGLAMFVCIQISRVQRSVKCAAQQMLFLKFLHPLQPNRHQLRDRQGLETRLGVVQCALGEIRRLKLSVQCVGRQSLLAKSFR